MNSQFLDYFEEISLCIELRSRVFLQPLGSTSLLTAAEEALRASVVEPKEFHVAVLELFSVENSIVEASSVIFFFRVCLISQKSEVVIGLLIFLLFLSRIQSFDKRVSQAVALEP